MTARVRRGYRITAETSTTAAGGWRDHALCAGQDSGIWFPSRDPLAQSTARDWCNACPSRQACLEYALAMEAGHGEDRRHGIYGGLDGKERHQLQRRRRDAENRRQIDDAPVPPP